MHKNVFTLPVNFIGSYTQDEPNLPWQNNLILQKKVSGVDKLWISRTFWDLLLKEVRQVLFKDLNRIQGLFKTTSKIQDLFKIVRTMGQTSNLGRLELIR